MACEKCEWTEGKNRFRIKACDECAEKEQLARLSVCKGDKSNCIKDKCNSLQTGTFFFSFSGVVYKTKIQDELQGQVIASNSFMIGCLTETSTSVLVAKIAETDEKVNLSAMSTADLKAWAVGIQAFLSGIYEKRLNNQSALELLTDEEALALDVCDMDWSVVGVSADNPCVIGE